MALLVFLRGMNVGGHRRLRPAALARELAAYDVVNVGAAGTAIGASDELFVHQLVGCRVVDQDGVDRGTVTAVEANPASDLLVLTGGALVPLTFVVSVDGAVISVDVPAGLFD